MKPRVDSTQLFPRPVLENPRVHLLDDIWLLTIVAILIATGVLWIARGFEVDIGTASWGLLALGGIYVAFTILGSPTQSRGQWRDPTLTLLHVVGVVLIGSIWQHVGALQNPMFLMVFVLPVIGAIFLSRWHPYLIAIVSVLVIGVVALIQAPELRWYAGGLLGSDAWLIRLFGALSPAPQLSLSGFYPPSSHLLVLLGVFTVMLFACAVAAEYVGTIFERLNAYIVLTRAEAQRGQQLWADLIESMPLPALLIEPNTMRILASSGFATSYLCAEEIPLEGRNLFDALQFSYPDIVQELIGGADGEAPLTVIRIANRLRVTRVRVSHFAHKGRRLALLTVEDTTEVFCRNAALDTSEYAALVIDARGRVLAFNKPAVGLFGKAEVGVDAAQLLAQPDAGLPWWEPGLAGRRKMHIEIGLRIYQVTSSAVALAGEEERIFVVSFLPVAKAGAVDPFGANSTMVTNTLGQLR